MNLSIFYSDIRVAGSAEPEPAESKRKEGGCDLWRMEGAKSKTLRRLLVKI